MEEMNVVTNEVAEVTEVATEVIKNYDWKDYAMTGLAGVGAVALLGGLGFGIYKGVKLISKKVAEVKMLQEDVTEDIPEEINEEE